MGLLSVLKEVFETKYDHTLNRSSSFIKNEPESSLPWWLVAALYWAGSSPKHGNHCRQQKVKVIKGQMNLGEGSWRILFFSKILISKRSKEEYRGTCSIYKHKSKSKVPQRQGGERFLQYNGNSKTNINLFCSFVTFLNSFALKVC